MKTRVEGWREGEAMYHELRSAREGYVVIGNLGIGKDRRSDRLSRKGFLIIMSMASCGLAGFFYRYEN